MAGAAWEYVVQFANTVQKDAWIHVPVDATDDYVMQLATLLKNNLDPALNLYVEYDNEVWNWGFPQSLWNLDAANAAGLNYITQYARRTVEVSNIFKDVWVLQPSTTGSALCFAGRSDTGLPTANNKSSSTI